MHNTYRHGLLSLYRINDVLDWYQLPALQAMLEAEDKRYRLAYWPALKEANLASGEPEFDGDKVDYDYIHAKEDELNDL